MTQWIRAMRRSRMKTMMSMKPLLIELFCGLGAVSKVFTEEGYTAVGFDIERHVYGSERYLAQLVLQDVLTLHGSQFSDAAFIWASPPCQEFSFMAMPFKRGKIKAKAISESLDEYWRLTALFRACFRIQREACEAAGHHIPMVVENVKGAQPWVGPAKANFGSYFLWGDVGMANGNIVVPGAEFGDVLLSPGRTGGKVNPDGTEHPQGSWFAIADSKHRGSHVKQPGMNWRKPLEAKRREATAVKNGDTFGWSKDSPVRNCNSKSSARKAASAMIAKIPDDLSRYLARVYKPKTGERISVSDERARTRETRQITDQVTGATG